MLLTKTVLVYGNGMNIKRYSSLGYNIIPKEYNEVSIDDVSDNYGGNVELECDYCHCVFTRKYSIYIKDKKHSVVNKDSCKNCSSKKREETTLTLYGVKNCMEVESIKQKLRQTNLERYGCENPFQNESVKEKSKQTMLEKYGVERALQNNELKSKFIATNRAKYGGNSPLCDSNVKSKAVATTVEKYGVTNCMQNPEVRAKAEATILQKYGSSKIGETEYAIQKRRETNLNRYGVVCTLQNPETSDKAKETLLKKYGVENCMQSPEIRAKALESRAKHDVNGVMCSSQQEYLCSLYGGNLNTPLFGYLADITFNDSNIYIEYSGSGHNIRVLYGKMTQEEFDKHEEIRRSVFLQNGYKEFEIISKTDKLPDDEFLVRLKDKAFDILTNTDFIYFGYNIDTNKEFYK